MAGRVFAATDGNGVRAARPQAIVKSPNFSSAASDLLSPADCDRIIIVGAGGFGREVLQWARHAWPEHAHKIAGFLSDDPTKLDGHTTDLPILGSPEDFESRPTDGFLLGIGVPEARRQVAERLEADGARFLTLVHPAAIVADTVSIGAGSTVCPFAVLSTAAVLRRFVLVNYMASVAHDSVIEDFTVMSPYATVAGNARVGRGVFLGMHASVAPGVSVGAGVRISSHSWARVNTPERSLVHGNPPTVSPLLKLAR